MTPTPRAPLVLCEDMTTVTVDDSLFVYDEREKRFYVLNASAAAIYARVDGRSSADEIADALALLHPEEADAVRADVRDALSSLLELGVIAQLG